MAIVVKTIWKENSDNPYLRKVKTQKTIDKEKKLSKFDVDTVKDFITEQNRRSFDHKCNSCKDRNRCEKWFGKIILSCEKFR